MNTATKPNPQAIQAAIRKAAAADYGDGTRKPRKPPRRCPKCGRFYPRNNPWECCVGCY